MRAASAATDDVVEVKRLPATPAEAAQAEAAGDTLHAVIAGKAFTLAPELNEFAMLEFAEAADSGLDSEESAGLAATLRFITSLVADTELAAFRKHCRQNKVTSDQLVGFIRDALQALSGRPTTPPSPSGAGRQSTGRTSNARASGSAGDDPALRALGLAPVTELVRD